MGMTTTDPRALQAELEAVFDADPRLRPRPDMHDYQLTYPPAVQIEQHEHRCDRMPDRFESHGIGELDKIAYYFHFGFCAYRCRYCFHYEIRTKHDRDLQQRYVEALLLDARRMHDALGRRAPVLCFLGGGTPTAIDLPLIARFLDGIVGTFGTIGTSLSTVEAKPVTATREKLRLYVDAGFRRINLGVQTLDPELYAYHHHKEDVRVALDAIERAREVGFTHVNIDIMTGLRQQSPSSWGRTLAELERLATAGLVDSVFIYPYHDDPRSPTFGKPEKLPSMLDTSLSEARARAMFHGLGWWELGPRFFRSRRHVAHEVLDVLRMRVSPFYGEFLYAGIGNSAFSVGDRAAWLNERDAIAYCDRVESGRPGISHFVTLDAAQRATRDLTFDVLYSPYIRVRALRRKYGRAAMDGHEATLRRWTELGLGTFNRVLGSWRLTSLGKLVHLQMIPALYLPTDAARFHRAMETRASLGARYRGY
jgi:oxygen-independent coproporphyrinogen-3 oxidase